MRISKITTAGIGLDVRPSEQGKAWLHALARGSDREVRSLVEREPDGVALYEIASFINELYSWIKPPSLPFRLWKLEGDDIAAIHDRVSRAIGFRDGIRHRLTWREQRSLDLGLLRWIRRASALSVVLGAGASMAAGGPSWAGLVEHVLRVTLERGLETSVAEQLPPRRPGEIRGRRRVVRVDHLPDELRAEAEAILASIEGATAEDLMRGAQLALGLLGQRLFVEVTASLYRNVPGPSGIHEAVAELADRQEVPGRPGGPFPGWAMVVDYNFDSLQLDALTSRGLPARAWVMGRGEPAYVPNPQAKASHWAIDILHPHGYTPNRLMDIAEVDFVFSMSQYEELYGGGHDGLIDTFLDGCLARPVHCALYVGCSFADPAMNAQLKLAHSRFPGRQHFAFLKPDSPLPEDDPEALRVLNRCHHERGIQPLWVEDYDEIPDMIRLLR